MNAAVLRYRVMAYVTGVVLVVLCFVGIPLQIAGHPAVANNVGVVHGILYIIYLVFAWILSRKLQLANKPTVIMLLAGTVPVIDGLALPALAAQADTFAARHAVGLIHHPTCLETGIDSDMAGDLRALEVALFPQLPRVIVTSPYTADCLANDFAVGRDRIHEIVPGTEAAPRSTGLGDGVCRVLSIGTLIPRKGHDVLLRAMAKLFDLDWHLTIAGSAGRDPVHAQTLFALAEELEITQRVTFLGELSGAPLAELWHQSDVFALATHFEGYGMVIAEALMRGLPIAVCDGGAAGDLVSAEAGVVCPTGDVVQLSKALRRVIFDAPLRQAMAEAAWQAGQALPDWPAQAAAFAAASA